MFLTSLFLYLSLNKSNEIATEKRNIVYKVMVAADMLLFSEREQYLFNWGYKYNVHPCVQGRRSSRDDALGVSNGFF